MRKDGVLWTYYPQKERGPCIYELLRRKSNRGQSSSCLCRRMSGQGPLQHLCCLCQSGGQKVARDLFLEIADNEKEHAQRYYEPWIDGLGNVAQNINIDAGYPVALGKTQDNLNYSYDAEWEEHTEIYPGFAQIAANEGFMDVSEAFARIAEAENTHAQRFHAMWEEMSQGLDLSRPTPVQWICTNCGYIHVGTQPPAVCPYVRTPASLQGPRRHRLKLFHRPPLGGLFTFPKKLLAFCPALRYNIACNCLRRCGTGGSAHPW